MECVAESCAVALDSQQYWILTDTLEHPDALLGGDWKAIKEGRSTPGVAIKEGSTTPGVAITEGSSTPGVPDPKAATTAETTAIKQDPATAITPGVATTQPPTPKHDGG